MGATLRAPAIPRSMTATALSEWLAERLYNNRGIWTPRSGSGYEEMKAQVIAERGPRAWQRIYREARQAAWERDGAI